MSIYICVCMYLLNLFEYCIVHVHDVINAIKCLPRFVSSEVLEPKNKDYA